MRNNQPVTSIGHELEDGEVVVTRTDAKGIITYVNDSFVGISGYSRDELLGQPHNIVRHPDVPPAAFADLWQTVKAGKSWRGIVKNRCKNGDFYWVEANVAPYYQDGVQQGYVSIRTRPSSAQIQEAEQSYRRLASGKGASLFENAAGAMKKLSIKTRLVVVFSLLALLLGGIGMLGGRGISEANRNVEEIYQHNLLPVSQMAEINNLMRQNIQNTITATIARASTTATAKYIGRIESNVSKIDTLLKDIQSAESTPEEKTLLAEWLQKRNDFVEKGLKPGMSLLKAGEFSDAEDVVLGVMIPRYEKAQAVFEKLVELKLDSARISSERAAAGYVTTRNTMVAAIMFGLLLAVFIGVLTIRAITRPLGQMLVQMDAMSHGNLANRIESGRHDEVGLVVNSLQRLQMRFVYVINDIAAVMGKVAQGNLDARVEAGSEGMFLQLKNNINVSLDTLDNILNDIGAVADGLASGRFDQRVTAEASGQLGGLKRDINQSLQQLDAVLKDIGVVMDSVSQSDLSRRVSAQAGGQLNLLKENINLSLGALAESMRAINANTRQVAAAASQTSTAIGQISDGAQNQMHAINQVANAVRETSRTVQDVAGNTDAASKKAQETVAIVSGGKKQMSHMVDVVNSIAANSEKINKITEVIEKIANKTNLLSLNAAIEAARAGEHGKGFAVVAEEVGKLAANSAESTQEIAQLVRLAVDDANRAVETVKLVSGGMDRIEEGAVQSDAMLQRISAALEQQNVSVQGINANVSNLNMIAESNAAASEEIAATVVELSKIADNTRREVEKFRV